MNANATECYKEFLKSHTFYWCDEKSFTDHLYAENPFTRAATITGVLLIPPIGIIGLISNLFILLIMRKISGSIRLLFQATAISDTVFIIARTMLGITNKKYLLTLDIVDFYRLVGIEWLVGHLIPISKFCSIYFTLLMTLDRYLAVCKPLKFSKSQTVKKTWIRILITIVCIVIYEAATRGWMWGFTTYCDTCSGRMRPATSEWDPEVEVNGSLYVVSHFINIMDWVGQFVLPWIAILIFNVLIIVKLFKAREKREGMAGNKKSSEIEITRCLIVVVILFFFLEFPTYFIGPVFIFFDVYNMGPIPPYIVVLMLIVGDIGPVFQTINSSINLYIYILTGKRFRKIFLDLFRCRRKVISGEVTATTSGE